MCVVCVCVFICAATLLEQFIRTLRQIGATDCDVPQSNESLLALYLGKIDECSIENGHGQIDTSNSSRRAVYPTLRSLL